MWLKTKTLGSSGHCHSPVTWMDFSLFSWRHSSPPRVACAPSPFFLYSSSHPGSYRRPPWNRLARPGSEHPPTLALRPQAGSQIPAGLSNLALQNLRAFLRVLQIGYPCGSSQACEPLGRLDRWGRGRSITLQRPRIDAQFVVPAWPTDSVVRVRSKSAR